MSDSLRRLHDSSSPTPRLRTTLTLGLLALLSAAEPAIGGSFDISPIRLELASGQRSGTVDVVSGQDKPLLVRATLKHWTQANGVDVLDPTEAMAVVPPVFKLDARGHQVLRVGFLGRPRPLETEDTYRLLLTEIPNGVPDPEDATPPKEVTMAVETRLTISMPVYVLPRHADELLRAHLQTDAKGAKQVVLDNAGNVHQRLSEAVLAGGDGRSVPLERLIVVLPGVTRSLTTSAEATSLPPPYRLRYLHDLERREVDVTAP